MKILTKNYILKEMTSSMVTKNYFNWFNDSEIQKYIDYKPKNIGELKNQVKVANNNNTVLFWGIFSKKKHIGNLKIFEIDCKRNIARLGILIGDKEFRNKGVGSEVIEAVKNQLIQKKIYTLWLGVDKKNYKAINAYKKVGFTKYKNAKKYCYMSCNLFMSKIILGGAQLNSKYGITNFSNKRQPNKELVQILNFCKKLNINHIDAAEGYDFFKKYKKKLPKNTKIDTKVSLKNIHSYKDLKKKLLTKYINKGIFIDALLIHDGDNALENKAISKIKILHKLKKEKIISKVGISIYNFDILKKIILKLNLDVIQIPYNIADKRIEKFRKLLKDKEILIYVRSVFLQGSLLKEVKSIKQLKNIFTKVQKLGKKVNQSNLEICLSFVFYNDLIDKIIIGVRNLKEMKQLMSCKITPQKYNINFDKSEIFFAQNPNRWSN
jgi:aryl-alcohol dehydrogenase-like predicted oxidoreductase/RimJ/RimL family protein N-acetyltransferase